MKLEVIITLCIVSLAVTEDISFESRIRISSHAGLTPLFEWEALDWEYPTKRDRQIAIEEREFIPGTLLPIDLDVYYSGSEQGNLIFMAVPKFQQGVPATLSTVGYDGKLSPYPNWSWHKNLQQCRPERIVSVFRVMVDECERLWVLDTGKAEDVQLCPPQLLSFDLRSAKLISRYEFPKNLYKEDSLFVTPVADVRDFHNGCRDTFVYIADVDGFQLLVYNAKTQKAYNIKNNLFYPYPLQGYFSIAGEEFNLMDGILGMALTKFNPGHDRTLFFHSLSSVHQTRVRTSILRNQTIFEGNPQSAEQSFYVYPNTAPSQRAAAAIDKNDIMYFILTKETALACWNTNTEFHRRNIHILERNVTTLQFGSGVKIVRNKKGFEELWIMTDRFQKSMAGTLKPTETNFRIQAAKIHSLLHNSPCLDSKYKKQNNYF